MIYEHWALHPPPFWVISIPKLIIFVSLFNTNRCILCNSLHDDYETFVLCEFIIFITIVYYIKIVWNHYTICTIRPYFMEMLLNNFNLLFCLYLFLKCNNENVFLFYVHTKFVFHMHGRSM